MPLPQISSLHIDTFLTGMSHGFMQDPAHFVADRVFPRIGSAKKSNKYATYAIADLYRDVMELRAPGTESAGLGYRVSNDNFDCDVFASHIDVDDQTVAAADAPFDMEVDAVRYLTQWERIKRDREWASTFFTTSVWTGGTAADPTAASLSGAWDDPASTPIEDIHEQANSILVKTGYMPNKLVVNNLGWVSLKNHPDVVDRVKYTSSETVSEATVARLLGLDEVVVGRGIRNTAQEGLAATLSALFGNHALLIYSAPAPGFFQPSGGYQFYWSGYEGATEGRRVSRFRIDERRSTRIELESTWDMKVVAADLGCLIQTVAS